MYAILFDLGNTLLDDDNEPLPGAAEMLTALTDLRDPDGAPVPVGLVSDFDPPTPEISLDQRKEEYFAILRSAGLERFFQPLDRRVTLSSEVGVFKPSERIFQAAIDRMQPGGDFHHTVFITENPDHIRAARELGMMAVHFKGPE